MRSLKILVTVLGVILVGGAAVLVGVIVDRAAKGRPAAPVARTLPSFGPRTLLLPAGARVEAMQGVGDRLVLRIGLPDGHQELMIVDPATGNEVGTIELGPGG